MSIQLKEKLKKKKANKLYKFAISEIDKIKIRIEKIIENSEKVELL